LLLGLLLPAVARAQTAPRAAASAPATGDLLARAKELFRQGNELRKAGDSERALGFFLRSREIVPSIPNTMNAAICLDQLGRDDEALDLYERLLIEFAGQLDDEDRHAVGAATSELRRRVASLDVSANVEGVLVVDGRRRGLLPLTAPVRLLPGLHAVRVLKDGYAAGEAQVSLAEGESRRIDLRLQPLGASGRLAVVDEAGAGEEVELIVDGAPVGAMPWSGVLAPGKHWAALRGASRGTSPVAVAVVAGQTVTLALRSLPLGPPARVEPEPRTARVSIDGVDVGPGVWTGQLPAGAHEVSVSEEGYQPFSSRLDGAAPVLAARLVVDPDHPRWRREAGARVGVELLGGVVVGSTFGGQAEAGCPQACRGVRGPRGARVGLRGSYELPSRLRFELGAGYFAASARLHRQEAGVSGAVYDLDDAPQMLGPYVSAGVALAVPVVRPVSILARASIGAVFGRFRDPITGGVSRGDERTTVAVEGSGEPARSVDFVATPELGVEAAWGPVRVGAGLGASFFLLDGPRLPHGDTRVTGASCPATASRTSPPLACLQASRVVADERAAGRFLAWEPRLSVGWLF
jgi:hypothetical protein